MRAQQFEALGVRRLYVLVAGWIHEPLIPGTFEPVGTWRKSLLEEAKAKTHYFAAANLARAACYIPQGIAFFVYRYWPGLVYVVLIWIAHLLLVCVEQYKRSLTGHWIPLAPDIEVKPERPVPEWPPGIYRLRPFETEKFYQSIGIDWFRKFSTWAMSTLTYGFSGQKMTFIAQPSRKQALAFERATRVSEAVHLGSAVTVAPLVVLSWLGAPLGIAIYSTVIVIGDVLLALLQRYHRARVWPVIQRMLERLR